MLFLALSLLVPPGFAEIKIVPEFLQQFQDVQNTTQIPPDLPVSAVASMGSEFQFFEISVRD